MKFSRHFVLLDVSRLVWRAWKGKLPTGIDRTCLAYVRHYHNRACAVVQRGPMTLVLGADVSRALFDLLLEHGTGAPVRGKLLRFYPRAFLGGLRTPQLVGVPYFNVGHTGLDRPEHAAWIRRSGVHPLYFIHDLIPLSHPEYCRPTEPDKHLKRMKALLENGAGVIGNSRYTLNELAAFAGLQQDLQMPPALVAPLGVAKVREQGNGDLDSLLPARPYFVILGTIEGRKNHLIILNIWANLARRLGSACPQLVVVGQRGWECEQAVDMLERCEAIRDHVVELPRCDDARLAALMKGARALLFPSFVEGYGLPLVEALSLKTPVIASDLAVFRELAGETPDYLSPLDGLGWTRVIEDYVKPDSSTRTAQIARMEGWQTPRWRDHFALVDQWLAQLGFMPQPAQMPNG